MYLFMFVKARIYLSRLYHLCGMPQCGFIQIVLIAIMQCLNERGYKHAHISKAISLALTFLYGRHTLICCIAKMHN